MVAILHGGNSLDTVGWIPPYKTTIELLFPPIPCLIGLSEDESEVLYGTQIYEAVRKTLPSPEGTETERGTELASSSWLNLKSMLADKEVEWRKGKVSSELPLAIFLIHVKRKIEAAIPLPSSTTNYKVILVLPQALSILQRGRIYDATKLAGFGEDQVHFIKETTAAALAFAHDAAIWSPGFLLPVLVCCPPPDVQLDSDGDSENNNADVGIFSNEDGILTMEESAGRQGLSQIGVLEEMTKFKKRIVPSGDKIKMNKNAVFVHLDGSYDYDDVPCSRDTEMQYFRALHDLVKTRPDDLLDKIRDHLTKYTVRYLHCLSFLLSVSVKSINLFFVFA
jgi:hypothetical protein